MCVYNLCACVCVYNVCVYIIYVHMYVYMHVCLHIMYVQYVCVCYLLHLWHDICEMFVLMLIVVVCVLLCI